MWSSSTDTVDMGSTFLVGKWSKAETQELQHTQPSGTARILPIFGIKKKPGAATSDHFQGLDFLQGSLEGETSSGTKSSLCGYKMDHGIH